MKKFILLNVISLLVLCTFTHTADNINISDIVITSQPFPLGDGITAIYGYNSKTKDRLTAFLHLSGIYTAKIEHYDNDLLTGIIQLSGEPAKELYQLLERAADPRNIFFNGPAAPIR